MHYPNLECYEKQQVIQWELGFFSVCHLIVHSEPPIASILPQHLKLCPRALAKVAEYPTSQNSGIMYDPFKPPLCIGPQQRKTPDL